MDVVDGEVVGCLLLLEVAGRQDLDAGAASGSQGGAGLYVACVYPLLLIGGPEGVGVGSDDGCLVVTGLEREFGELFVILCEDGRYDLLLLGLSGLGVGGEYLVAFVDILDIFCFSVSQ